MTNNLLRVELHSHTIHSRDCLVTPEAYIAACRRKGIQRAAVTDHNTAEGALRMQRMAPDLIVVGEEIRTTHGELLAYFLRETVPPDLPPLETVARIREQGGVVAVSHPADRIRREAMGLHRVSVVLDHVDALETFNARCILPEDNRRAAALARECGLPGFCGSDAHTVYELGRATMLLAPFDGPEDFLQSLQTGCFAARASIPLVHFASRWAKWMKKLGLVKPIDNGLADSDPEVTWKSCLAPAAGDCCPASFWPWRFTRWTATKKSPGRWSA